MDSTHHLKSWKQRIFSLNKMNTWLAWREANSDELDHFTVLDANHFGREDQAGLESDSNFNAVVMSFASEQIL